MTRPFKFFGYLLIGTLFALVSEAKADPIHEAAEEGDVDRVSQLLAEGADVNAPDDEGTPLQWALFADQLDVIRLLLQRGADPNVEGFMGTPLEEAALNGDTELVKLLLDHDADLNGSAGSTPLYRATQKGNLKIIELLLAKGADPDATAADGMTPLHEAARKGDLEAVQTLVDHGADVNALTAFGKPSIHLAVYGGYADVAAYLREKGATPGETAPITDLLASADVAVGEADAQACTVCHSFEKGKNYSDGGGPSLWNVVGRARASVSDFAYSEAFGSLEGDWTFDALNAFLARPTEVIPGMRMNFGGIADPRKRANLIAFLRTLSDNPRPLPMP